MELLSVTLTSLISVFVLFILAKMIGNRAISQMNMFDYVNSITMGSIAAELAVADMENIFRPLVAMVIYAAAVVIFAFLACKSLPIRRVVVGKTLVLFEKGQIYDRNFKKAKIDINEFMMQCRLNGFFKLDDIECAMQESNGRLSILPKAAARPTTPKDFNLAVNDDSMYFNVILDGEILKYNLKNAGFDGAWLDKQLKNSGISKLNEVFVGVCSADGEFYAYKKQDREDKKDRFDI